MIDQAESLRRLMQERGIGVERIREGEESVNAIDSKAVSSRSTRVIAITSGKGGVGKTNFSINLGIAYAQLGKKVVVLDADLGLANVNVILGIIPPYNLYHVMRRQKRMKDIILSTEYGIEIVAGASGFSRITNLSESERRQFVEELTELSRADVILIDTSAGVGQNVLSFIQAADDVVVVTTPEPTAITDAYGLIKIVSTEMEERDLKIKLVINRVSSVLEAERVAKRMINITGQFLNLKIDYLGYVYEDPSVAVAVRRQVPFMALRPKDKASLCLRHIAGRLENIDVGPGGNFSRFLRRLLGGKGRAT